MGFFVLVLIVFVVLVVALMATLLWSVAALAMGAFIGWLYAVRVVIFQGILGREMPEKPPYNPDIFPIIPDP